MNVYSALAINDKNEIIKNPCTKQGFLYVNMKGLKLSSDLILQQHSLHLCRHDQIHSPQF